MFDIPIVIFTFKRTKNLDIYRDIITKIIPKKVYFFSDGWRNEQEKAQVLQCREAIQKLILPEETQVNYVFREKNYGCFDQIAGGAYEVFQQEECAIFLEDDNIPDMSFFEYCQKALEFYKDNERVFIIWGTNYLIESKTQYAGSFTRHFLPCGWASWRDKFTKYYHLNYQDYLTDDNIAEAGKHYCYERMFQHDKTLWEVEYRTYQETGKYLSWDFQLCYYLRLYDLVGLLPKYNLIVNNGIDLDNTHGGGDGNNKMLQKLCPQKTHPIEHFAFREEITINKREEKKLNRIRIPEYYFQPSLKMRILRTLSKVKRGIFYG